MHSPDRRDKMATGYPSGRYIKARTGRGVSLLDRNIKRFLALLEECH